MSSATAGSDSRAAPDNAATSEQPTPGTSRVARPRVRLRVVTVFALVLLAAVVAVVVGLLVGPAHISAADVVGALARRLAGKVDLANWRETAVVGVRLPRVLVGFVAGGALAVAGAALQGLFRNPLAEPGVLGISSGASLGAVLAIYLHVASKAVWLLPACAFAGAATDARAGLRHRGAPGPRPRVHGDAAAGRRRADVAERIDDDLHPVDLARQLQRRARGDVLAARRPRGTHLGSPAAGRARHPGGDGGDRGARAGHGRALAGRGERAVGRRRRAARAPARRPRERARRRRGGRDRRADRLRRAAGAAHSAAGGRRAAPGAGAAVVLRGRRVPGHRRRRGADAVGGSAGRRRHGGGRRAGVSAFC